MHEAFVQIGELYQNDWLTSVRVCSGSNGPRCSLKATVDFCFYFKSICYLSTSTSVTILVVTST